MRLSRPRVVARAALLAAASAYLAWRAVAERAGGSPLAMGWAIMSGLALLAALAAVAALRRRPARQTLRLGDLGSPRGSESPRAPRGSEHGGGST
ncbi:MAG TPA: hypothetical protein VFP65_02185 [Anaeromyxobacteraceae bacterium]|nr:hypothetical protein [Anaeromyxobacteraceae bacterium]